MNVQAEFDRRATIIWLAILAITAGCLLMYARAQSNAIRAARRSAVIDGRIPLDANSRWTFIEDELKDLDRKKHEAK